jgi:hypothetical protein
VAAAWLPEWLSLSIKVKLGMGRGGAGALFSAIHRDEVLLLFTMEEGKGAITH